MHIRESFFPNQCVLVWPARLTPRQQNILLGSLQVKVNGEDDAYSKKWIDILQANFAIV